VPHGSSRTSRTACSPAGRPCVMVDFTRPEGVLERIQTALSSGLYQVVGTTGFSQSDLAAVREWCRQYRRGAIIAPNFAVGAVVMMKLATLAARHFASVEIVELHHDRKLDAPSGTAIKTAQLMAAVRKPAPAAGEEKVPGARGGEVEGIRVHSVRLPGLVAHQEVIFGNPGEVLTIRHDSLNRESFMPGVLMAIRRVVSLQDLLYGIEALLFPEG
ncbi:MAG: 4-hydroxy-tetrahydrodipicolinate reductase, partial [Bacillota bacterium]|nr:4-hydroxy-tetrahydrodipicolinate reductase [Bacillota bacterium]